ncbi:hypothetical protein ACQ4PT_028457 [Festuca glaucescens]
MATLTGTGANIIPVGMWSTYFPEQDPMALLMYSSKNTGRALSAYLDRTHLRRELSLLVLFHGNVGDGTVTVSTHPHFLINIRGTICHMGSENVTVTPTCSLAMQIMMATLLFIILSGKNDGEKLMDWGKCRKLQWNIILLLGAGFAIADGFKKSGLTDILSEGLGFLRGAPALVIAPVACIFSGLITEFTSDDATTTLVLPLLAELGRTIGVHLLLLMVPGAVGVQLSYLLPTGSLGNVVGFSTGYIKTLTNGGRFLSLAIRC